MKLVTFLSSLALTTCVAQQSASKTSYTLIINKKEYKITEGEDLKLNLKLDNPIVSIKSNDKEFSNEFVSFSYPHNFSEEVDNDEGFKSWTLDGDNLVITVYDLDLEDGLAPFVQELINNFGVENCSSKESSMTLGTKTFTGKKIEVTLVNQKLTIDFLSLPSIEGKTRILSLQDSLSEDGTASKEKEITVKKISETIAFK